MTARPAICIDAVRVRKGHHPSNLGDAAAKAAAYANVWSGVPMSTTASTLAEHVVTTLRAHEAELRRAGIRRLSLFGSVARGDAEVDSDVDLAAELDPAARIDLVRLVGLERRLAELVGRTVDLLPEPVEKPRLRAKIERDRIRAF
jgi:predicted nucleotidyltransferase